MSGGWRLDPPPSSMTGERVSHLYLHVPFCRTICPYCDFAVTDGHPPDADRWTDALRRELRMREEEGIELGPLETILVGGGTPSVLGAGAAVGVESIVGRDRLRTVREWTVEANPEDIGVGVLSDWVRAGVTRVNIGVQSLRPSVLDFLGRTHDAASARRAMEVTADSGVRTWGVDILYGLPPRLEPDPVESLLAVIDAGAPHVSLYELAAEPGTPLGARVASGAETLADDDARADRYLELARVLGDAGYTPYEMTAFALPGHASIHQRAVLAGGPWLGLGPGAHTLVGGQRSRNLRDWMGYLTSVIQGESPDAERASAQPGEARLETLWFRLRSAEGIGLDALTPAQWRLRAVWVGRGLAADDAHRLRLTPEGWLRLDELAIALARVGTAEEPPPSGP